MSDTIHVLPLDDLIEHDSDHSDECICGPDTTYVEGGGKVITHHSLDGRELHEYDREDA